MNFVDHRNPKPCTDHQIPIWQRPSIADCRLSRRTGRPSRMARLVRERKLQHAPPYPTQQPPHHATLDLRTEQEQQQVAAEEQAHSGELPPSATAAASHLPLDQASQLQQPGAQQAQQPRALPAVSVEDQAAQRLPRVQQLPDESSPVGNDNIADRPPTAATAGPPAATLFSQSDTHTTVRQPIRQHVRHRQLTAWLRNATFESQLLSKPSRPAGGDLAAAGGEAMGHDAGQQAAAADVRRAARIHRRSARNASRWWQGTTMQKEEVPPPPPPPPTSCPNQISEDMPPGALSVPHRPA